MTDEPRDSGQATGPDLDHVYRHQAQQYQELIAHEDHEGNLLRALSRIVPLDGIDVVETGTGTGRLALMLAPFARSIRAFDLNPPMVDVARSRMAELGYSNIDFAVGGHRDVRVEPSSADLVIAGWSLCYVHVDGDETWRDELSLVLDNARGFLRPGGTIVVIETLGTGFTEPVRLPDLAEYLDHLDSIGFQSEWIRTDYLFADEEQARRLSSFFFGDDITSRLRGRTLPECTGLWWLTKTE